MEAEVESGPRMGTRVEGAEEGRCEGEEGVGVAPSVRWTSTTRSARAPSRHLHRTAFCTVQVSTPLGAPKYDDLNLVFPKKS